MPIERAYHDYTVSDFAADDYFIRWVTGTDAQADSFWNSFIEQFPEKQADLHEARTLVVVLLEQQTLLPEQTVSKLRENILHTIRADAKEDKAGYRISWLKSGLQWAAMISIPLTFLFVAYFISSDKATPDISGPSVKPLLDSRSNSKGQRSVWLLPDGTRVWLNADSKIEFRKDFNAGGLREVSLVGEAYFDVASNPEKPFIVRTPAISITVLGTAFNIKSYPEEKTIETTLVHGKISLNKTGSDTREGSLILNPNQRAVFSKETNAINVENVQTEKQIAWRLEKLVFDETPFEQALLQLERWYNIKIHLDHNASLTCSITAEIENEKLEDVLALLKVTHNITYDVAGGDVFIHGSLCK